MILTYIFTGVMVYWFTVLEDPSSGEKRHRVMKRTFVVVCNGKVVPSRWSRSVEGEPFVFTRLDGTPSTLGMGRTYIAVTLSDGVLEYIILSCLTFESMSALL